MFKVRFSAAPANCHVRKQIDFGFATKSQGATKSAKTLASEIFDLPRLGVTGPKTKAEPGHRASLAKG